MALHFSRRHRADCDASRPNEFHSSELEERRQGYGRQCRCQIQISGTLGGRFSQKSTGTAEWAVAGRVGEEFEKYGSWNGTPVVPPPARREVPEKPRVTPKAACRAYTANRDAAGLKALTIRNYYTFAKPIRRSADGLNCLMLEAAAAKLAANRRQRYDRLVRHPHDGIAVVCRATIATAKRGISTGSHPVVDPWRG